MILFFFTLSPWKQTVHNLKPRFVALHFQEVGGKDYMVNMGHAEHFFWYGNQTKIGPNFPPTIQPDVNDEML